VQDDVHAARGVSHGFRVARIDFDNLRAGRRTVRGCPAHQTHDCPSGIPEDFRGQAPDAPGGTQYEYASAHPPARLIVAGRDKRWLSITSKRRWSVSARDAKVDEMGTFLSTIIVPIAIGAVAIVLLLGLANMMRGGSPNTSQKLMRLRVLLQAIAIVVIMFTIWMIGR
jgi:hypothetical protein